VPKFKYKITNPIFQWLKVLFAGLSSRIHGFDPRYSHVTHVKYKLTLKKAFFPAFLFPLSVPFHQCFTLIFILIPLLAEGQMSDAWEPSNRAHFFLIFGRCGQKRALFSFFGSANSVQACESVFETVVRIVGSNCVN
jgi:hypothetical protein